MSDRFHQITMEQLTDWVFTELEEKDAIFGIPRSSFFVPSEDDRFRFEKYGQLLETPFGVAAGPHTQMAQNIIVSWLVGARFLELKTIQTLDELDVNKPCIDLEDEGYNVEWSQELKVFESFDEYLRAWVLIHALHKKLDFPGDSPGMIFNMSVGYNLEGIKKPNVQWYFDAMADASPYKQGYVDIVAERYPEIREIDIPDTVSDTITLSTMHGCPPDEIEAIVLYLLNERKIHTSVKCNPTLLGADRVRGIINEDLGFTDIPVPDEAFGHDLKYVDAVPMFHNLRRVARANGLTFGLKLSNTLEVENHRTVFDSDEMMYMSGRALHAVTTNLALRLTEEFKGDLLLSFAGGADAFNVSDLMRSGMATITVCSDLLKTGGYLRLPQYIEELNKSLDAAGAASLTDFIANTAVVQENMGEFVQLLAYGALTESGLNVTAEQAASLSEVLRYDNDGQAPLEVIAAWAADNGFDEERTEHLVALVVNALKRINLRQYGQFVRTDWRYLKGSFRMDRSKTERELHFFDCIEAPCVDECPVDQDVPAYMRAVRDGDFDKAVAIVRADNPLGSMLGRVCDHLCETTCIRTHMDEPLAIREMKRFIMEHESATGETASAGTTGKVAIIGAGPAGIAAGQELGRAGFSVTIFEAHPYAGGMVGGAIPEYRIPQAQIDQDMQVLHDLGVEIKYNMKAGTDFSLSDLKDQGFQYTFVAVGAQLPKYLGFPGEDSEGVIDALAFLRSVREGRPMPVGPRVGVVGAGDTAMDCVRSAWRVGATETSLIYRRTIDQMPADREEIRESIAEGINIIELANPHSIHAEDGKLRGLVCTKTEYRGDRDASGRKIPFDVPDSEFEIELDTLILAISQHSLLDFFGDEEPLLTPRGYIEVDPDTYETSLPGVYAGGDVAADGPSSIVKAAADGKVVASAIIKAATGTPLPMPATWKPLELSVADMVERRARREYRVPVKHTPLDARDNFDETLHTYTVEQAQAEASRCLDCDTICSLCVGVCPNMALMTYETSPFRVDLPTLSVDGGTVAVGEMATFRVDQSLQIAVLTDFCNECGNCTTACPTAGEPYRDKPRLYLDRGDFEAEKDNAFWMAKDGDTAVVEARWDGETHRLAVNGQVEYSAPAVSAVLEPETLALVSAAASAGTVDGQILSLEPAAQMYALWRGLDNSMSHLPVAGVAGTKVGHPGYEE
ncbi:MAG: FAD-dependent oxidoreductase [Acidimicrobiia bacterium]|nr:FAD-dependent oxidoreductase [Acidimicrobiia bacterium]